MIAAVRGFGDDAFQIEVLHLSPQAGAIGDRRTDPEETGCGHGVVQGLAALLQRLIQQGAAIQVEAVEQVADHRMALLGPGDTQRRRRLHPTQDVTQHGLAGRVGTDDLAVEAGRGGVQVGGGGHQVRKAGGDVALAAGVDGDPAFIHGDEGPEAVPFDLVQVRAV